MKRAKQRRPRQMIDITGVIFLHPQWPLPDFFSGMDLSPGKDMTVSTKGTLFRGEIFRIEEVCYRPVKPDDRLASAPTIRQQARARLAEWFANECINPFMEKCKAAGMSDDESVAALNVVIFDETRGLNGF